MSRNVQVLFIGVILMNGMIMTGSLNMNAYAETINGDNDDNTLRGTSNDDRLKGKNGSDVFYGYSGADYFDCGKGKDTIKDFNPSEGDKKSSGCEKVHYKGKNHDDGGDKSGNNGESNSANQGINQGQSIRQSSQCVSGLDIIDSCNNDAAQTQANTENNALAQQGGSGHNDNGDKSANQGINQGQSIGQSSQCVAGGSISASCNNDAAQTQANTGNNALAQQGGSGHNDNGDKSANQGINQGQSIDQESQCVSGEDAIVSCDNVAFQSLVNSGNSALGQRQ